MGLTTHLVVSFDHETKTFTFDGDGSREWIRRLFTPETNTWSDEAGEYVEVHHSFETEALLALQKLGVSVLDHNWQKR